MLIQNNKESLPAITIDGISKTFGETVAIKSLSLTLFKGEMFGLVGPDGAGKTTTMRILCALTKPEAGNITIFGKPISTAKREIQNGVGYLSQKFSLYGDLTVDENIEFFARIHQVKNFEKRRDELLELMRLIKFRDRAAEKLSGGMKQKLALACSLIHKPEILFLDEPTTGVDPVSRRDFWKILSTLQRDGITILLTTPYLDEAERCNRIGLMNQGELIAVGTPAEVKNSVKMSVLEIYIENVRKISKFIQENLNIESQAFGDRIAIVTDHPEETLGRIEKALNNIGLKVTEHRIKPPSLENIFIHLVSNNYR
ncbi:MAG: ABC transporter ATP-binding protein [Ignavibacteriales bacterium]|nr:ABC transporter ATP-binding protein [Ignavibacteriales bacterium]